MRSAEGVLERLGIVLLLLLGVQPAGVLAQSADTEQGGSQGDTDEEKEPEPTHRLDVGVDWFDTPTGAVTSGALKYIWAPLDSHSFSAGLPLVDSGVSGSQGSGIGDLQLQYNYVPSGNLTASPWVPDSVGTGLGLVVPTGSVDKGTGAGQWVVTPQVGWVVQLGKGVTLLPQGLYSWSFSQEQGVDKLELLAVQFGILYVRKKQFWVQYTPGYGRDLEHKISGLRHKLILGRQFTHRFGLSLDIATLKLSIPGNQSAVGREAVNRVTLKSHWILAF